MIFTCAFVLIDALLISPSFGAVDSEKELQINDVRFFFNPPPPIKPTAAITHHEPGLPPGWTRPSTRPTPLTRVITRPTPSMPYFDNRWLGENLAVSTPIREFTVESQVLDVSSPSPVKGADGGNGGNGFPPGMHPPMAMLDESAPDKNAFLDWILGLFGRPTQKPISKPPTTVAPPIKCRQCQCGASYKYHRIVGGVETIANAYPWMVYLTYLGRFYCGASVINDRYLLTAAHCVEGFPKERLAAVFLDHDRSTAYETKTFTRRIGNILKHGSYGSGGTFNNDIALLRMNEVLDFSGLVKPVCLPPVGRSFTGYRGLVTGWGATESTGQVSNVLRQVEVPILSNNDCKKTGYGRRITDNMICAGYPQGLKDSCQGDSGGPMHVVNNSAYQVVGIVSWGEGCAQANYPGVYTRVNRYITWITSNTRDACYC